MDRSCAHRRAWPAAPAPSISTRLKRGSCRCSRKLREIFSIAGWIRRHSKISGPILRHFAVEEAAWLNDYALYAVLRREFNTGAWTEWPEPLRRRDPKALAQAEAEHERAVAIERVLQFAFSLQWDQLRDAAEENGIRILGDVAIFVNMDSADVWVHPGIFELDNDLKPIRIAGVPPDYFSPTGQRWGNPLYRWDVLASPDANGVRFDWWVDRIRRAVDLYDIVRLDHFRGFEAYWAIPAKEETAINGKWIKAPGLELFRALETALGPLPLVAEDLGLITPEVDALRQELGMPGMKVLQFGFSNKGAHTHLPQQFTVGTVAYTGTHDNDTTQGWWNSASEKEHQAVEALVGPVGGPAGVATDSRSRGQRGSVSDRARAGSVGTGLGGAHEYARGTGRKLELARA